MIDDLYTNYLEEKSLFLESGIPEEVQSIRESLDTNTEFAKHSPHSMAEALVGISK